ncbi:hypothetical protein FPQ18DRAFT_381502 [Pyronema domesticum]|nr:hypothetical protein FPQ18DRAFT_381502 [Pyronema domesticum]
MKATLILPWASALFIAAASAQRPVDFANKRDLCTEVCWLTDVGNVEGCKNRCMANERPTPMEATESQKCIDNCGTQYLTSPTVALFDLCRRGCLATYFPAFIAPVHKLHKRKGPGLPVNIHELLKGRNYPVRREVCELSCKAQGHGSYMSPQGALNSCVQRCTVKPTAMEEETQVMYDCSGKKGSDLNMCLEDNIKKAAISAAAQSTGKPIAPEQEKKQQLPNYTVQTSMKALTATTAQPFEKISNSNRYSYRQDSRQTYWFHGRPVQTD